MVSPRYNYLEKDKTVPWSTNGFMQRKFEYILFFSKSPKYKSNKDKVRIYDTSQLKNGGLNTQKDIIRKEKH